MSTYKKIFSILIFVFSSQVQSKSLCLDSESAIFSFSTRANKLLSICKERSSGVYIVYRFGTEKNIELQYPEKLDENSWKRFTFFGVRRGGGIKNSGFGEYTLEFKNSFTSYQVYQSWSDEDGSYGIGVNIMPKDRRSIQIHGIQKTQEGSLVLLEQESGNIQNKQQE